MKFEDLTKQAQLLVYMYEYEAEGNNPFSIAECGPTVIECGITKNKQSLSSMLNILANKGYIEHDGYCGWLLTNNGRKAAIIVIEALDDAAIPHLNANEDEQPQDSDDSNEEELEDTEEQPVVSANDAMKIAFDAMAKSFEAMSKSFAALNQIYS